MKKNILIIDNSTGWTGAFKSVVTVAQHLSRSYNFHFCIPDNSSNKSYLLERNFPVLTLNFIEISKRFNAVFYLPQLILNTFRIKKYCKAHAIEIVHVNDLYNLTGVVLKKAGFTGKLIYHIRLLETSYVKRFYKTWIKIIGNNADYLVAVSNTAKVNAARYTRTSIEVIYDCLENSGMSKYSKSTHAEVKFLYLANYIPGKGHDVALNAFAEVAQRNPNTKLIFAGSDLRLEKNLVFKKSLLEIASRNGIADQVEVRGFEPDVEKMMQACDVFLNFSESESFSMTCLEAISSGKPVIATASGGPEEIIINNECGILIPVGDVQAATEAMLELSFNHEKRLTFGQNGVRQACNKFDLKVEAAKLSGLYSS